MPKTTTADPPIKRLHEFNSNLAYQVIDWKEKNPATFQTAVPGGKSVADCSVPQLLAICLLTIQQGLKQP